MAATVETRTQAEADKSRNGAAYRHRAACPDCGYTGRWTGGLHAEDLAEAHRCDR